MTPGTTLERASRVGPGRETQAPATESGFGGGHAGGPQPLAGGFDPDAHRAKEEPRHPGCRVARAPRCRTLPQRASQRRTSQPGWECQCARWPSRSVSGAGKASAGDPGARGGAQDRVDQPCRPSRAGRASQLHRGRDRRIRGYALHVVQLVHAHAQQVQDRRVEALKPSVRVPGNGVVETAAQPRHPVGERVHPVPVAGRQGPGARVQGAVQALAPGAGAEHPEGDPPGIARSARAHSPPARATPAAAGRRGPPPRASACGPPGRRAARRPPPPASRPPCARDRAPPRWRCS